MTFGADSDEGVSEAYNHGWRHGKDEGYEEGEEAGFAHGYLSAVSDMATDAFALFMALKPYQYQSAFDAIKAEAMRLGVKP